MQYTRRCVAHHDLVPTGFVVKAERCPPLTAFISGRSALLHADVLTIAQCCGEEVVGWHTTRWFTHGRLD